MRRKKEPVPELKLTSTEEFKGDILTKTAELLKTQPDYVVKTIERFLSDIKNFKP